MSEIPMPDGEYDVIYADPPWSYNDGGNPRGGVDKHYETMDIDALQQLPVSDIAADDCILYMWGTVTHVEEYVDLIRAWGFSHKSQGIWDKLIIGAGSWFRNQHENLNVAVRGAPSPPRVDARRESVFQEQRTEHSRKPKKVREYIEDAHPDAHKLELFARDNRVGWEPWGNEVPETEQQTL